MPGGVAAFWGVRIRQQAGLSRMNAAEGIQVRFFQYQGLPASCFSRADRSDAVCECAASAMARWQCGKARLCVVACKKINPSLNAL
jgi:hypothetical protein